MFLRAWGSSSRLLLLLRLLQALFLSFFVLTLAGFFQQKSRIEWNLHTSLFLRSLRLDAD